MSQNLISGVISAEDLQSVKDSLNVITEKLPFLSAIQNVDVSKYFKPGNAYKPFLDLSLQVLEQHPEILPAIFDQEEFKKDGELYNSLEPIALQVASLNEGLQKTQMAVGSDTLKGALEVYAAVKQHKNKVPGLSATYDEMRVFFKRNKIKS